MSQLLRSQPRPAVVQPEQLYNRRDIGFAADVIRRPAGFGVQVVQVYLPRGNELFTNANGKRQIGQAIPVQVPDLPSPDVKKDHPATMRFRGDSWPGSDFLLDPCSNRVRHDADHYREIVAQACIAGYDASPV